MCDYSFLSRDQSCCPTAPPSPLSLVRAVLAGWTALHIHVWPDMHIIVVC